jgi:hypothetical protein
MVLGTVDSIAHETAHTSSSAGEFKGLDGSGGLSYVPLWRRMETTLRQERTGGRLVMSVEKGLGAMLVTYDILWCLTLYLYKGLHTRGRTVGANLCR